MINKFNIKKVNKSFRINSYKKNTPSKNTPTSFLADDIYRIYRDIFPDDALKRLRLSHEVDEILGGKNVNIIEFLKFLNELKNSKDVSVSLKSTTDIMDEPQQPITDEPQQPGEGVKCSTASGGRVECSPAPSVSVECTSTSPINPVIFIKRVDAKNSDSNCSKSQLPIEGFFTTKEFNNEDFNSLKNKLDFIDDKSASKLSDYLGNLKIVYKITANLSNLLSELPENKNELRMLYNIVVVNMSELNNMFKLDDLGIKTSTPAPAPVSVFASEDKLLYCLKLTHKATAYLSDMLSELPKNNNAVQMLYDITKSNIVGLNDVLKNLSLSATYKLVND